MNKTLNDFQFNLNSTAAVRILDRIDSSSVQHSYLNRVKEVNRSHLAKTTNGFQCFDQMVSLQVRGSNQLHKEINQTHTIDDKVIFGEALHRNEMTGEQEGEEVPSKGTKKRGPVGMSMVI